VKAGITNSGHLKSVTANAQFSRMQRSAARGNTATLFAICSPSLLAAKYVDQSVQSFAALPC
jgi:hypothetical protein